MSARSIRVSRIAPALRLLEVEREAFLVAIDAEEVGALARHERRSPGARVVASPRTFDLDHARAHVRQHQRAVRPRHDTSQIEDGDARENVSRHRAILFALPDWHHRTSHHCTLAPSHPRTLAPRLRLLLSTFPFSLPPVSSFRSRCTNCSSRIDQRLPFAAFAPPLSWDCGPSRSTATKTGSRSHRFKADEALLDRPRPRRRAGPRLSRISIAIIAVAARNGADAIHPGLRIPLRERPPGARLRRSGHLFRRPDARASRNVRRQGRRAKQLAHPAGVPTVPGTEAALNERRRSRGASAKRIGFSAHHQGQLRRRRPRHAGRHERRASSEKLAEAHARGRRRRSAAPKCSSSATSPAPSTSRCRFSATRTAISSISGSATARCSGAIRRSSRSRRASTCRTSCGERSARRPCVCAARCSYRAAGTVEFLVDVDTGRVLLHRGQPAHSGRAHGHRDGHRHRPGAQPDSDRRGHRCTRRRSGPGAGRDRNRGVAMQCRVTTEDPDGHFIPDYGRITTYRSPADLRSGSTAATASAARHHAVLRLPARQSHDVGRRSRKRCSAPIVRCANSASAASRRTSRSCST